MELRTLKYFYTVATEGSMSKAAELLYVSQPALSKQLKALEEELGVKLFIRHSFNLELTKEGTLLKEKALNILNLTDDIKHNLSESSAYDNLSVSVGVTSKFANKVASVIRKLKDDYPSLNYTIAGGNSAFIEDQLKKNIIDFAILSIIQDPEDYNIFLFPETDVSGILMSSDSPLAQKTSIKADDLVGLPLFCNKHGWDSIVIPWSGDKKKDLRFEGNYQQPVNCISFIKTHMGYMFIPKSATEIYNCSGLTFVPLEPQVELHYYLVYKKEARLSSLTIELINRLKDVFSLIPVS